jgi:hypothetical protein
MRLGVKILKPDHNQDGQDDGDDQIIIIHAQFQKRGSKRPSNRTAEREVSNLPPQANCGLYLFFRARDRIKPLPGPQRFKGMAAAEAPKSQHRAPPRPMQPDRLIGVIGAGGQKPALPAQKSGQTMPVQPDQTA